MSLHNHICRRCGKHFDSYFESARFCSKDCYRSYRTENKKCKDIKCPVCGQIFLQPRPNAIFCSIECRTKSTQKRATCMCDHCGKSFDRAVYAIEGSRGHYCSIDCKKAGMGWSFEDTEILKKYYHRMPNKEIAKMLSVERDIDAIRRKAQYIGLGVSRIWSQEEIDILEANYSTVPMNMLMEMLPTRSRLSIIGQARQRNLLSYFYLCHNYSKEEDDYLRCNYLTKTNEELGLTLHRTAHGIEQHLRVIGLQRPTEIDNYKTLVNYVRSRLVPWRDRYRASHDYTCAITGAKSDIVVHHIRAFGLILSEAIENTGTPLHENIADYSQEELDTIFDEYMSLQDHYDQVICLSSKVHKEFHKQYGYGGNTKSQWDDFVRKNYSILN